MSRRDHRDLARRLLDKARGDEVTLEKLRSEYEVPDEVLGFHAQQAVEKTLKAVLAQHGIDYPRPRIHDVEHLLRLIEANGLVAPPDVGELKSLTPWALQFRYEDAFDERLDRDGTLRLVRELRTWAEGMMAG